MLPASHCLFAMKRPILNLFYAGTMMDLPELHKCPDDQFGTAEEVRSM